MRSMIYVAAAAALTASLLPSQGEVLYYRFDSATGPAASQVLNYAAGTGAAPAEASLTRGAAAIGVGRFGSGLAATRPGRAANSVDTGWSPQLQGSFTVAMFVHNSFANDPRQRTTLFGAVGGLRGDVGATPNGGFVLSGWGGPDLVVEDGLPWCFLNGWTHVAIVVDASASVATLYRGGVAVASSPLPAVPSIAVQTRLYLGDDGSAATPSLFAMDEVRLLDRAAGAAEIAAWSRGPSAAVASFGAAHGVQIASQGGLPATGNSGFGFQLTGPAGSPGVLVLGVVRSRTDLSAIFGSSVGFLHTNLEAPLAVSLDRNGEARLTVPIPVGVPAGEFFAQAFALDGQLRSSPALACGLGTQF